MTEHKHKRPEKEEGQKPEPTPSEGKQPAPEASRPAPEGGDNASEPLPSVPMIAISMEEYSAMQAEKEKAQQECSDYLDGWQRERAEFQNYRRRVERDQAQATLNITGQVIKKYLVILDDLERALKTRPTQGEGAGWSEGVELIYRKLQTILENEGVERIPAETQTLNPAFHEALTHEESPDHQSGQVIEVVQQGYKIGDRVLRPALVRVAK